MRVNIGGQQVGLAGLDSAFVDWRAAGRSPAELTAEELVAAITRGNYVPPSLRSDYGEAVRKLYREWLSCSR